MSYSWGVHTPNLPPTPPELRPRPRKLPNRATIHYWINRAIWWTVTVIAAAFAVLSLLAGNRDGAVIWAALFGLGFIAQAHLKLARRVDHLANPRRIDLGARPTRPDRLLSRGTQDTRLVEPPPPLPWRPRHDPGREVPHAAVTCPIERFPTRAAADTALVERRARAALSGSPVTTPRTTYDCRRCGGAHITRAPGTAAPQPHGDQAEIDDAHS
jgi:hypothetical protein